MSKGHGTMIVPSRRSENIRYAVRDIVLIADELVKEGREILYLNIGDPLQYDFETPPHMVEACHNAMKKGHNGYSPSSGVGEAIDAVRRSAEAKGIREIRDIYICTGGSEAIELALTALVNEGENVLMPYPIYPLYSAVAAKLGAEVNAYYLDEENGWQPDADDMESRINEKTRAVVLINPNNPTGSLYRRETLERIVELAREKNLVVLCDEIYDKILLDDDEHVSIASMADDVAFVTFNGISKSYLAPGWRIGWGIVSGPDALVGPYCEAIKKYTRARLCANNPMQHAVRPALEGPQDHLGSMIEKLRRRRDVAVEKLNAIPGISCVRPDAAFYAFPRLHIDEKDETFVPKMIRETGVLVVHGDGFGQKPETRHFRIVLLPDEEILSRACDKIAAFMAKHAAKHAS